MVQVWCETNLRRCISKFHRFVCDSCDKAFPLRSALDRHKTTSHPEGPAAAAAAAEENKPKENGNEERHNNETKNQPSEQEDFMEVLGLQHTSKVPFRSKVLPSKEPDLL